MDRWRCLRHEQYRMKSGGWFSVNTKRVSSRRTAGAVRATFVASFLPTGTASLHRPLKAAIFFVFNAATVALYSASRLTLELRLLAAVQMTSNLVLAVNALVQGNLFRTMSHCDRTTRMEGAARGWVQGRGYFPYQLNLFALLTRMGR